VRIPPCAALLLPLLLAAPARATWSIVAVDPETREVGIAGASCIGGVEVIAGLAPGHGAVAAQALSHRDGRDRAVELLEQGRAPAEILDAIATEEWDPTPWHRLGGAGLRQYAIASLAGPGQATFTGDRTFGFAGAVEGSGVAVAGNTLAGPAVVERAFEAFRAEASGCRGDLADRLVAALWAGAAAGGDARCVPQLAALSAFVAVARPGDEAEDPWLAITVPYEGFGELLLQPLRAFVRKGGDADENPVRLLAERYRAHRAARGEAACLPEGTP